MSMKVSPDELRAAIRYEDGQLYWRNPSKRMKNGPLGCPVGDPSKRGGQRLQLEYGLAGGGRASLYVHRIVWALHHGAWPNGQIDHINGNPRDNRIENLRDVSPRANTQNVRHLGISFDRRKVERPWRARIMLDGRSISLGYYGTKDEAHAVYEAAKLRLHDAYRTGVAKVS